MKEASVKRTSLCKRASSVEPQVRRHYRSSIGSSTYKSIFTTQAQVPSIVLYFLHNHLEEGTRVPTMTESRTALTSLSNCHGSVDLCAYFWCFSPTIKGSNARMQECISPPVWNTSVNCNFKFRFQCF